MRTALLFVLALAIGRAMAQDGLLINEVLPANAGSWTDDQGRTPDWLELYNSGDRPVDLLGMRLAIGAKQHVFGSSMVIPSKGHMLLLASGRTERGADHLPFHLPRAGGTLLLVAADGVNILDLFTWPGLPADVSMARFPDGTRTWSFSEASTPGAGNFVTKPVRSFTTKPVATVVGGHHPAPVEVSLDACEDCAIRYTLDGEAPDTVHGLSYVGPIMLEHNTVLRARAFAIDRLPGPEYRATYVIGGPARPFIALQFDPDALHGANGIYGPGEASNHTRSGREWERVAVLEQSWAEKATTVGARIHGSGSRGLAKRSFKLYARDRYGDHAGLSFADEAHLHEGILRADATQHAFLRNRFIEEIVRRHGLRVDVQPSTPMPLYLNGRYWGLYRWMPAKDPAWSRQVLGVEAVEVVAGPAARSVTGRMAHFRRAQSAILDRAPLDTLDALIDLGSLIDLACIDLWTGRGDHDLNVRAHRPAQQGGRWRWVLFDLDLWAPAAENSVARMTHAALPETPYLPWLLAHAEVGPRLLARLIALQATAFHPASALTMCDSIHLAHSAELQADHRRWDLELDHPAPEVTLRVMRDHISQRPEHLMRHLATRTGHHQRVLTVEAPPTEQGELRIEGLAMPPGTQQVRCLQGVPIQFEVAPADGFEFAGWKGADATGTSVRIEPGRTRKLRVDLRAVVP